MQLNGLTIGFGITGSFCTHNQIIPEVQKIVELGANVIPILSYSTRDTDTHFGTAKDLIFRLETITGNKCIKTIVEAEPIGPKSLLDVMVVAPCTGNTLAKLANGITDTPVTMACKAQLRNNKPVVLAISTNDGLGANAKNLAVILNTKNYYVVPFCQDDPENKPNSLVAKTEMIVPAILSALKGKQIQPILYGK